MNKIILTMIFCAAFLQQLAAQNNSDTDFNIWSVQKDSSYAVFANKAYLRSGPGINNAIIDSVIAGENLLAIEQTKEFTTVRNIYAPWLKVNCTKNGKPVVAYIWEGMLAIKAMPNSLGTQFIYGLERREKPKVNSNGDTGYFKYVIHLKAVNNDTLAGVAEWKMNENESTNFTSAMLLGNTKLQNLQEVVRIAFGGEACGIPTNFYYYGWTGNKFVPLPEKYNVSEAGLFSHIETLLFPNEKGGQAGKIIKLIEEEEMLEEETGKKKAKTKHTSSKEIYVWNGEKAIRQKL